MPSMTKSPALLAPLVLILLAGGWFGYRWFAEAQQAAADRAKLLGDVEIELGKATVDSSELSALVARIKKLPDHETANDLLAAEARIELARNRSDKAADLFLPIASRPGAAAADQALGARILLMRQEAGAPDRAAANVLLEQAHGMAAAAYATTTSVDDLLRAWLAAMRLSDKARTEEFANRITTEQAGSPAAAMVQLCRTWQPSTPKDDIERVAAGFDRPPVELDAMLAIAQMVVGDTKSAAASIEVALSRAPGVVEVRDAAAKVFHVFVIGNAEGSSERAQWAQRRDAQIEWLLAQAAVEDGRRPQWLTMRQQR